MPYGGKPTAREIITKGLEDGTLKALFNAADTEKSIREALGICEPTWLQLKKEIPRFARLSTRTRKHKFLQVKDAMLRNAIGFEYQEYKTEEPIYDEQGEEVGKKEVWHRYKAPDYNSARVIMTNIKVAEANQAEPDPEITGWSNKAEEALEIKAEGGINLLIDSSVQSVLEALSGN